MTTLKQIQSNPKCNVWGSLGSRNRVPELINVPYLCGKIWTVDSSSVTYNDGIFNETIDLSILPTSILESINLQIK